MADYHKPSHIASDSSDKTIILALTKVCLHPAFLLPVTQTEAEGLTDIWSDGEENGHQMIGIEFTGFEVSKDNIAPNMQKSLLPKRSKTTKRSRDSIIALYPNKIVGELCIPKICTMKVSEIKNYVPGLLTTIVMLNALVDKIADAKTIVIVAENVTSLHVRLCALMIQARKQCRLVPMSDADKMDVIDVAIVLDVVREEKDVPLPKVKRIICIKSTLSAYLQNSLFFGGSGTIVEVDPKSVFTKDNIGKMLPKVVAWYNKQSKRVYAGEHSSLAHSAMRSHAVLSLPLGRKGVHLLSLPFGEIKIDNQVTVKQNTKYMFDHRAAYVVVGGLTGLGWEMVQILAERGVGLIAIMSRSGTSLSRDAEIVATEQQRGCSIICCKCDITDYAQVEKTFSHILSEAKTMGCIIEGIFQGAGVLEGSLIQTLTEEKLSKPMKPKILGTLNLHIASREYKLKYFVMHSSITSVLGNLGQCAYAAGNAFMDTFALWRRSKNLSAISINWGALEVGMATRDDFTALFIKRGYLQLTKQEIKECLHYALIQDQTGMTYTNINWQTVAKDYSKPNMERLRLKLGDILDDTKSAVSPEDESDTEKYVIDWKTFESSDMKTKEGMVSWLVLAIANYVLPTAAGKYTIRTPFAEIGMDSMTAVTFTDVVNDKTRVRIPLSYMLDLERCLKDVVAYLMMELTGETCVIKNEEKEVFNNDLLSERLLDEIKADEHMATISNYAAVTIPNTAEQQAHDRLGSATYHNKASDLSSRRHINDEYADVQQNRIENIVSETHKNDINETSSGNKESVENTDSQTTDDGISESEIGNINKMFVSKSDEIVAIEECTDRNATRADKERKIVSCYHKTNKYVFDESNVVNEKSETQQLSFRDSKGTLENKPKEKWDDWIRRKAKTDTGNKKIELKGLKDTSSQELKRDFQITFVPDKPSTSQVKSLEKWGEWIHRKERSVSDRPQRSAKLARGQKDVK